MLAIVYRLIRVEKCLHDSDMFTAVSSLSPVSTHILMPASRRALSVSSTSSCCSKFDANSVELRHVISQEEVVGSGAPLEMVVLTDSKVATGTPNITARPNFEKITKSRKVKNRIGDNYYCAGIFLKSFNII